MGTWLVAAARPTALLVLVVLLLNRLTQQFITRQYMKCMLMRIVYLFARCRKWVINTRRADLKKKRCLPTVHILLPVQSALRRISVRECAAQPAEMECRANSIQSKESGLSVMFV